MKTKILLCILVLLFMSSCACLRTPEEDKGKPPTQIAKQVKIVKQVKKVKQTKSLDTGFPSAVGVCKKGEHKYVKTPRDRNQTSILCVE